MKRYAIVRVRYDNCPIKYMIPKTYKNRCILHNKNCEQCGRNGDTKEQLIRKVAQVISRYRNNLEVCEYCDMKDEFEIAEEIVEFLGVEK